MTTMDKVRPVLKWFTRQMDRKLALPKNVAKSHWREMTNEQLLKRIRDETLELEGVLLCLDGTPEARAAARSECVDVADMSMMLADNLRRPHRKVK